VQWSADRFQAVVVVLDSRWGPRRWGSSATGSSPPSASPSLRSGGETDLEECQILGTGRRGYRGKTHRVFQRL